jgi:hypothetical protein
MNIPCTNVINPNSTCGIHLYLVNILGYRKRDSIYAFAVCVQFIFHFISPYIDYSLPLCLAFRGSLSTSALLKFHNIDTWFNSLFCGCIQFFFQTIRPHTSYRFSLAVIVTIMVTVTNIIIRNFWFQFFKLLDWIHIPWNITITYPHTPYALTFL